MATDATFEREERTRPERGERPTVRGANRTHDAAAPAAEAAIASGIDDPSNRVFVLGGEVRHGLVAVRNLGRHGLTVTAGVPGPLDPGRLSKYADRAVRYPRPVRRPGAFVDAVERELAERDYDVLLPVNRGTLVTVLEHRERLEAHATIPYPPNDVANVALDKWQTVEAARAAGIPHPSTVAPTDADLSAAVDRLGFPIVVKPRRGSHRIGVSTCETPTELERTVERVCDRHGPVILQEYIPNGGERGVYTLYDRLSTLRAVTVQQRLRSNPPEGGPSTLRETVDDPALVDLADRLFSHLGWQGVAMAEFRIDPRDGEPKLLEVNPRLWGSLALSVFAGVEFPYLMYRLAVDGAPGEMLDYDVGVRSRWLFGDAKQLLSREDRLAALREFLAPQRARCTYDVLSLDDPLPAIGYFLTTLANTSRRSIARLVPSGVRSLRSPRGDATEA